MHAFDVLRVPVRRRILELLADGAQTSGAICAAVQEEFGISQPAVSSHLRVLRESGFATVRAEGTRRLYAVETAPLQEVDMWLERFRRFGSQRLDALATEIARGKRERHARSDASPSTDTAKHQRKGREMIDITGQINATHREIGTRSTPTGEARSVVLRRTYDAPIEDVWEACSEADRLERWFFPVSGTLRQGGTYQIEGIARGDILRCERPTLISVTWVYEDNPATEVTVRLSSGGDGTTELEFEHLVGGAGMDPGMLADALVGVGVGWDGALLSLDMFVRGQAIEDHKAWQESDENKEFVAQASAAWGVTVKEAGVASGGNVSDAVEHSVSHYGPGGA
ncbi:hypothetical protein GCM10029978_055370 [Actinoallomurus acanthiterrae]